MKYNFIAIEGNIGAGKTTLAEKISQDFNARLVTEQFEDNSFLPKFYNDPDKYAFPLEMSFLAERYQQLKTTLSSTEIFQSLTISDYFIDKSLIFARNNLKGDEYTLYTRLFNIISQQLPRPELLVYLYVNTGRLLSNIKMRGRDYEMTILPEYLDKVQAGYLQHFRTLKGIPILIIDTNQLDFVLRTGDYERLVKVIMQDHSPGIHTLEI